MPEHALRRVASPAAAPGGAIPRRRGDRRFSRRRLLEAVTSHPGLPTDFRFDGTVRGRDQPPRRGPRLSPAGACPARGGFPPIRRISTDA